ncbi:hypothetical protein Kfla_2064 [Kribbella flavida DSM 17836]|uniref:Uncharacterized protein n=1 Tax=Kribbella flavida (strain DSM 17836 / JCM 10339 / NBRC 14399) TaxID=479435 RepID=D2PS24_KRIFD|nr:hypothetical protein [Kribbella flavida]ADB31148.1 hypothetical protein Kfla_2064 [Kribbella flavida DSM 17836]
MGTCEVALRLVALLRIVERDPAPHYADQLSYDAVLDAWFGIRSPAMPSTALDQVVAPAPQLTASGSSSSGPLLRTEFTAVDTA